MYTMSKTFQCLCIVINIITFAMPKGTNKQRKMITVALLVKTQRIFEQTTVYTNKYEQVFNNERAYSAGAREIKDKNHLSYPLRIISF